MTTLRFIHASDLHLGRRFTALPDDIRHRLVEARHGALARLAQAARDYGAGHILLAGDVFDSETPSAQVLTQALAAMAAEAPLVWWLLPGNHDSLAAEALWSRIAQSGAGNVRALADAAPVEMAPAAMLLPAPLPRRYPGRDLTAWMEGAATPEGALRIGLAHGAIRRFDEEAARSEEVIPPDRARTAGLDYLALGDWHGQMQIDPRCWYSGTPERDGFRHAGRGSCLAVTLAGPDALPEVTPVETGLFHWEAGALPLLPGQDAPAALSAALPPQGSGRRNHLLRLLAEGRARLPDRAALTEAAAAIAPEFGYFDLDDTGLGNEYAPADLDEIDRAGALRIAAGRLADEAGNGERTERDRALAGAALNRLYGYLREAT